MGRIDEVGEVKAGNPDLNETVGDSPYFLLMFADLNDENATVTVQMDGVEDVALLGEALITIGLSMGGTL